MGAAVGFGGAVVGYGGGLDVTFNFVEGRDDG